MAFALNSLGLFVRDLREEKIFYTEALGCRVIDEFSNEDFLFLATPKGMPFYLQVLKDLPPGLNAEPGGVAVSFEVENIEAVWRDWEARGVEILSPVADMGAGLHFYAKDPEGHCLCIIQMYPQSRKQAQELGFYS